MNICGKQCPKYTPEAIAVCQSHGEYLQRFGCYLCREKELTSVLFDTDRYEAVPVKRYILMFSTVFIPYEIIMGYYDPRPNVNLLMDIIAFIISSVGAAVAFIRKYGRPFNPAEYRRMLGGSSIAVYLSLIMMSVPSIHGYLAYTFTKMMDLMLMVLLVLA